jgi:hypothetical protein
MDSIWNDERVSAAVAAYMALLDGGVRPTIDKLAEAMRGCGFVWVTTRRIEVAWHTICTRVNAGCTVDTVAKRKRCRDQEELCKSRREAAPKRFRSTAAAGNGKKNCSWYRCC